VEPLDDALIRASFVNCSKGEAKRLNLPADLEEQAWSDLDFLGWVDPRAPQQSYLVVPSERHGLVGVAMRRNPGGGGGRAKMCSLCTTTHPGHGVSLMVARRAHQAGRDGNSVGLDICGDLGCSLQARGLRPLPAMSTAHETLSLEGRVSRLRRNTEAFLARVLRPQSAA
jgi:hypothetical protein